MGEYGAWTCTDHMSEDLETCALCRIAALQRELAEARALAAEAWEDAVRLYAVWDNGEQLVGVMRRPLADVLKANPYSQALAGGEGE